MSAQRYGMVQDLELQDDGTGCRGRQQGVRRATSSGGHVVQEGLTRATSSGGRVVQEGLTRATSSGGRVVQEGLTRATTSGGSGGSPTLLTLPG